MEEVRAHCERCSLTGWLSRSDSYKECARASTPCISCVGGVGMRDQANLQQEPVDLGADFATTLANPPSAIVGVETAAAALPGLV